MRLWRRGVGHGVDDLAGAGVVELLACLVFDGIGIVLEAVHVALQEVILVLEALQLLA